MITAEECIEEFRKIIDDAEYKKCVTRTYQIVGGKKKKYVYEKEWGSGIVRKKMLKKGLKKLEEKVKNE